MGCAHNKRVRLKQPWLRLVVLSKNRENKIEREEILYPGISDEWRIAISAKAAPH